MSKNLEIFFEKVLTLIDLPIQWRKYLDYNLKLNQDIIDYRVSDLKVQLIKRSSNIVDLKKRLSEVGIDNNLKAIIVYIDEAPTMLIFYNKDYDVKNQFFVIYANSTDNDKAREKIKRKISNDAWLTHSKIFGTDVVPMSYIELKSSLPQKFDIYGLVTKVMTEETLEESQVLKQLEKEIKDYKSHIKIETKMTSNGLQIEFLNPGGATGLNIANKEFNKLDKELISPLQLDNLIDVKRLHNANMFIIKAKD